MEDKANQALEQLLERAISGIDSAVEFSQAQIPDVVEQLLLWHAMKSAIFFCVGLALLLIPVIITIILISKWENMNSFDRANSAQAVALLGGTSFGVGVIAMGTSLDWLQILIAPKLYLLEYAAQLVK